MFLSLSARQAATESVTGGCATLRAVEDVKSIEAGYIGRSRAGSELDDGSGKDGLF